MPTRPLVTGKNAYATESGMPMPPDNHPAAATGTGRSMNFSAASAVSGLAKT
jgi:hypothetical protein